MPVLVPVEAMFILDGLIRCAACDRKMTPVFQSMRERHYTCRAGCERFTVEAGRAERYTLDSALRRLSTSDDAPYIPGWTPESYEPPTGQAQVAQRWNAASAREQRALLDKLIHRVMVGLSKGQVVFGRADVPLSVAFHRRQRPSV
ncbi:MAG: zinc ribbon domain-containing protein [Actinocatenispora sp.]